MALPQFLTIESKRFRYGSAFAASAGWFFAPCCANIFVGEDESSILNWYQGWRWLPAAVSALILLCIFIFLEWAGHHSNKTERADYGGYVTVMGSDGRISTSKTVALVWTFLLAAVFLELIVMLFVIPDSDPNTVFKGDVSGYLLLLGGPFASAVLAKAITTSKQNPDGQNTGTGAGAKSMLATASASLVRDTETPTVAGTPSVADIVQDDNQDSSVPDLQYVIFSLVAIVYFFGAYMGNVAPMLVTASSGWPDPVLPVIPQALLGLTSLAALTYVGSKAVTKDAGAGAASPSHAAPTVKAAADAAAGAAVLSMTFADDSARVSGARIVRDQVRAAVPTASPDQIGDAVADALAAPGDAQNHEDVRAAALRR